jgi:hypothetical protein
MSAMVTILTLSMVESAMSERQAAAHAHDARLRPVVAKCYHIYMSLNAVDMFGITVSY